MPANSELLGQHLHEVDSKHEEDESSKVQIQNLVGHLVGDLPDGFIAVVVGALVEHEVEEAVEGEGGKGLKPSGELGRHLVRGVWSLYTM